MLFSDMASFFAIFFVIICNFVVEMTQIALFNAQHDLALAHGRINYVPNAQVSQLLLDLQWLPLWYAPVASRVLVYDKSSADELWASRCAAILGEDWQRRLLPQFTFTTLLKRGEDCLIEPWGWDLSLRHRLALWGVNVPTVAQLECWRGLSHRRLTMQMLNAMGEPEGVGTCPQEMCSLSEVERYVTEHGECFVKAPWSGSGRGVFHVAAASVNDFASVISGIIKRQGSVMCERALDRTLDFAIELKIESGKVMVTGYSVFTTDEHHQFGGSLVMPHDELRLWLLARCPDLDEVQRRLVEAVGQLVAPHYEGVLGVDMMLYRDKAGVERVAPCVEVNLRHTMGMVAWALGERVLAPGRVGRFKTEFAPAGIVRQGPEPQIEEGKLRGGRLYLTPVEEGVTKFAAFLEIEDASARIVE